MKEKRWQAAPLRQLGWGFLLAWVFCVFYTTAASTSGQAALAGFADSLGATLFDVLLPLGASVVSLAVIVAAEPRFGAPTSHRSLMVAAPLLTAASTPLMFAQLADPVLSGILYATGSVATGIGSALLWVMWGEYYAVIPREEAEWLAPVSAVSAALLVLVVSATSGWVALALASLFPLLSGWCFRLAWDQRAAHEERALGEQARSFSRRHGKKPLAGLGRTGFGILAVFALVSIAGMMHVGDIDGLHLQAILVFSAGMMALVAVAAVSGPRRISLSFLYRWMCPTLVVGFCAIILFGVQGGIVAYAASLAGRFTFCLIAQVYFASYAASGHATPAQATSLGWLFVHAGDLVGCALWIVLEPWAATTQGGTWAAVIGIVALVSITMLTLGEGAIFHRPSTPLAPEADDPAPEASAAAPSARSGSGAEGASAPAAVPEPPENGTARKTASKPGAAPISPSSDSNPEAPAPTPSTADAVAALAAAHRLTPRETEVFALLAQERSIPYIRDELIISRETAATHAKHIYAKLGVHSRQELIDLVQKRETIS